MLLLPELMPAVFWYTSAAAEDVAAAFAAEEAEALTAAEAEARIAALL